MSKSMTSQEISEQNVKLKFLRKQFEAEFNLDIRQVYDWLKNKEALPHTQAVHQRDVLLDGILIAAITAGICDSAASPSGAELLGMLGALGLAAKRSRQLPEPSAPVYTCHACGSACSPPEPYKWYAVCNTCHVHTAATAALVPRHKKPDINENLRVVLENLLKEELDNVEHLVHVCDQNNDAIKARRLPPHILDLYNFLNPETKQCLLKKCL
jgi:hypothetical protein